MPFSPCRTLAAALLALAACAPAAAAELVVSAAASLSNALREVAPLFEAAHPGTQVQLNFGASGSLLQQIARGAPVDVFASADQQTMDQAQSRSLVEAGGRRDFVSNSLVVVVPVGADVQRPRSLAALATVGYARIAVGNPASVPAGRYAKRELERVGLWPAIEAKTIGAQSVRQALDYVARGEVDAGFVYATDAALRPDKVKIAFAVPTPTPILYPIAPLAASAHAALAREFVAFVLAPPAQAVLARHGFGNPSQ